jgi:hypothetical protein
MENVRKLRASALQIGDVMVVKPGRGIDPKMVGTFQVRAVQKNRQARNVRVFLDVGNFVIPWDRRVLVDDSLTPVAADNRTVTRLAPVVPLVTAHATPAPSLDRIPIPSIATQPFKDARDRRDKLLIDVLKLISDFNVTLRERILAEAKND